MPATQPSPVFHYTSHGLVSLTAGFLTGLVFFTAIGAAANDAIFSALALALLVAVSRGLAS